MGEFISFVRTKETEPKKSRPIVLASGYSARFSLDWRCGTRYRSNSPRSIRSKLPVLDNPKGD